MKRIYFSLGLLCSLTLSATAQDRETHFRSQVQSQLLAEPLPSFGIPAALPRLSPELALENYQRRSTMQSSELAGYSSTTVIRAELPQSSQFGEFELQRHYSAPRTLQFKAIRFMGDNFVKSNIIVRLLQSEVDHVQKDDAARTSLTQENYRFSFKASNHINGRDVIVYQVKPLQKRVGLFKGRVSLDAYSAHLVRVEGSAVKSPSLFIRRIDFVQDYADFGEFTFPVHIHSEAQTRLVGRAVVDIEQKDVRPVALPKVASSLPAL